jgi:hypothetical protein
MKIVSNVVGPLINNLTTEPFLTILGILSMSIRCTGHQLL